MRPSASPMRLGTFLGAPIYVTWSWLLFVLVIVPLYTRQLQGWIGLGPAIALSVLLALLWGVSVLLHELGHVAAARWLKCEVDRVEIGFLGGATSVRSDVETPRSELLLSAAGPAVSLLLGLPGGISLLTGNGPGFGLTGVPGMLVSAVTLANLAIGLFNLLPGLPLDGGRMAVAALWKATGDQRRASVIASYIGQGIAAALGGYALWRVVTSNDPAREIPWVLALAIMSASLWGMASTSRAVAVREAELADVPLVERLTAIDVLPGEAPAALAATSRTALFLVRSPSGLGYADRAVATGGHGTLAAQAQPLPDYRLLAENSTALDLLHALRAHDDPWYVVVAADGMPLGIVGAQALAENPVALTE